MFNLYLLTYCTNCEQNTLNPLDYNELEIFASNTSHCFKVGV